MDPRCSDPCLVVGSMGEETTHHCTREPGHVGKHSDGQLTWAGVPPRAV